MKTPKKVNDYNLRKYHEWAEELKVRMIKTIEVTWLPEKAIKRLLRDYTHSEIRLKYRKK
jgi:hypothetical protein